MIKHTIRIVLLALFWAGIAAPDASARGPFDGAWSVLVVTERGACDRAYRYGVEIRNGRVIYLGSAGVNVSGGVSGRGALRVTVSAGSQRASGTGRLSRGSGSGRWSGQSPTGRCSGYWTAERR